MVVVPAEFVIWTANSPIFETSPVTGNTLPQDEGAALVRAGEKRREIRRVIDRNRRQGVPRRVIKRENNRTRAARIIEPSHPQVDSGRAPGALR